jgi:hypothetical protein
VSNLAVAGEKDLAGFERERLAELEAVIDRGAQSFVDVGMALLEIRDTRLYRDEHRTFEDYCNSRWGFGRDYGYKLIRSASVAATLLAAPNVDHGIQINARQARELADAPDPISTWNEAREKNPRPTAKQIREIVMEQRGGRTQSFVVPSTIMSATVDLLASPDTVVFGAEGLDEEWRGRVFIFPSPEHRIERTVAALARRADSDFQNRRVDEVLAVFPAQTDAQWFHDLHAYDRAFFRADSAFGGPLVAFYFGYDADEFANAFDALGKPFRRAA